MKRLLRAVITDPLEGTRVFDQPPPKPIDGLAPEAGADVAGMKWIPGYWSWSDEASDYVWVSGLWREVPYGRTWIPFWMENPSGHHRWTSGSWAGQEVSVGTTNYVSVPPRSNDSGPSTRAPGEDYF